MTALPTVPNCLELVLYYSDGSDSDIQNKLYFSYSGAVSPTDLQTLCALAKTAWGTHMAPNTAPNVSLLEVFGNDLNSQTGAQAADGQAPVVGSALSGHELTSGAAFVMSNEGSVKYRGGHSRNYLPGMHNDVLADANTWTETFQAALLTAWSAFISEIISQAPAAIGALAHVIAHRFGKSATAPVSAGTPSARSVPLTNPYTEKVVAYRTNPQVGSQRRRNLQID